MSELQYHPAANIFPLMEGEAFADLVEDIREHGLREAVILTPDRLILDGRNRYRACLEAGIEPRFETYEGTDFVPYVVSLNLKRRHLNESQRAMVGKRIANLKRGDNQHTAIAGTSQAEAAKLLNVSEDSIGRAGKVQDKGAPELTQAVERGEVSVSAAAEIAEKPHEEQREIVARGEKEILEAAKAIRAEKAEKRRAERVEKIERISSGNKPLLADRKYPVIYADPPWRYENPPMGDTGRSIENHYPTMTLAEICALPVSEVAYDDSILFMWATAPKLAECMDVITAWGFSYRTCLVWVKDKIGMGYYARNKHELLLIARKGELPPPQESARFASVIEAPRTEHSAKPLEFYELIESMYPDLSKIELFARSPRDGWAVWGNQSEAA